MTTETSETSETNDTEPHSELERLRKRVDVLEKRLWDLEVEIAQYSPEDPPVKAADPADLASQSLDDSKEPPESLRGQSTHTSQIPSPEKIHIQDPPTPPPPFEVIDVDGRLSGESEEGVDYVWKITMQSKSEEKQLLCANILFVDHKSKVVETVEVDGLVLFPGRRQKFTGKASLTAASNDKVAGVKAHVTTADA